MLRALRTLAKLLGLLGLIVVITPLQRLVLVFSRGPASMRLPMLFHRSMCALLGVRIEVAGVAAASGQAVFICNHLSHLDIPVIGSVLRASFVAKDDVRDWPVAGWLASLQHTVFVSRNPRRAEAAAADIARALQAGHRLVLFPEGTTSDGSGVLPFRSGAFAVLAEPALDDVVLQPMTITLLEVDGKLVQDGANRDLYAYYGEMSMGPHLLAFMGTRGARLRLTWHTPLPRGSAHTRKELAALAFSSVSGALESSSAQAADTGKVLP